MHKITVTMNGRRASFMSVSSKVAYAAAKEWMEAGFKNMPKGGVYAWSFAHRVRTEVIAMVGIPGCGLWRMNVPTSLESAVASWTAMTVSYGIDKGGAMMALENLSG
jgi:hypothetical protein